VEGTTKTQRTQRLITLSRYDNCGARLATTARDKIRLFSFLCGRRKNRGNFPEIYSSNPCLARLLGTINTDYHTKSRGAQNPCSSFIILESIDLITVIKIVLRKKRFIACLS
jgi:hypothetical protein